LPNSTIQELVKSKIAKNQSTLREKSRSALRPEAESLNYKLKTKEISEQLGSSREEKPLFLKNQFSRPTLLKNLDKDDKVSTAKLKVAEAHTTITRATVHADFAKQAKAHRNVKLGFTRTPRVIAKLMSN
jgi:hypothetical protein